MYENEKKRYKIVSVTDWSKAVASEMEEQVNKMLDAGWKLRGNLISSSDGNFTSLFQAMVKDDDSSGDDCDILDGNL